MSHAHTPMSSVSRQSFVARKRAVAKLELEGTRSVWTLGASEGGNNDGLERVGDVSPNRAFGRCLVYRLDVSELSHEDMSRLCKELYAFRLCRHESGARLIRPKVPVDKIDSRVALNGWEVTIRARALYRDLPYSVKFMIKVCLRHLGIFSANKCFFRTGYTLYAYSGTRAPGCAARVLG